MSNFTFEIGIAAIVCMIIVGFALALPIDDSVYSCNGDFCGRGGFVMVDGEFTGERM